MPSPDRPSSLLSELRRRNVLRVALAYLATAWLLLQVMETLFPVFDLPDSMIRLTVIVLAIGFPLALIVAWLFELTPQGFKRERDVDHDAPAAVRNTRLLDRAIIAMLTLAAGYFAVDKFIIAEQRVQEIAEQAREEGRTEARDQARREQLSIVVLPFRDMSPAGDLEYLSDGLAEELLHLLARVEKLRVISRTSSFSYKGREVTVSQVAQELAVGHVLEGSVRRSGDRLRITVQLIDALTDAHLWSETYDRVFDDLFAIQDDIARQVVSKLQVTVLGALPTRQEVDPEAYSLFLQANHLRKQSSPESFEQAVELYEQALAIAPNFVAAWDRLALVYCMQANFGLRPAAEGYGACREATVRALAIDPTYAPALSGLAWIAMQREGDFATAATYYQRALALEPSNISIIGDSSTLMQYMGRLDEAITLGEYASARDPVNPIGFANLGVTYRFADRLDDALRAFRKAIALSPERIGAYYQLGVTLLRTDQPQEALEEFTKETSEDWRIMGRALASHALGRTQDYEDALDELKQGWGDRWPDQVAQVYAWVGEKDLAFEWLEKAYALQGSGSWPAVRVDDLLKPLHSDDRWQGFAEKLGIPQTVLDEVEFEITLPDQT